MTDYPYTRSISLAELGRSAEALALLREFEPTLPGRLREFAVVARTLIEGQAAESIAAVGRIIGSDFRDPEGLFYLARHLAHLHEVTPALDVLDRVVASGYVCYPSMARDPWLDPLRKKPAFTRLLRRAETLHQDAVAAFERLGGQQLLAPATVPA